MLGTELLQENLLNVAKIALSKVFNQDTLVVRFYAGGAGLLRFEILASYRLCAAWDDQPISPCIATVCRNIHDYTGGQRRDFFSALKSKQKREKQAALVWLYACLFQI